MRNRPLVFVSMLVTACGGTPAGGGHTTPPPLGGSGGDRVVTSPPTSPGPEGAMVRAVERVPMPTCEAGDLRALASLTEGMTAQPAIASHENGALVAFLSDPQHDGSAELAVIAVDAQGAPRGNATVVNTGPNPAHPALIAQGDGYVLAWREGAPTHEQIVARRLGPDGAVVGSPLAFDGISAGWMGAPALAAQGETITLAVVTGPIPRDLDARRSSEISWARLPDRAHGRVSLPRGGVFDAESPPVLVTAGDRTRLFVTSMAEDALPGSPRALLEVQMQQVPAGSNPGPAALTVVATEIASPRGFTTGAGAMLTWRARTAAHDVAARVWPLDGNVPPTTVATFRGAQDAEVALLPAGENLLGAFTLSTLADDDGGTLNVSVITDRGQLVGRQPLLVSSLVRTASVLAAATSERLLFVLEGRADNGRDAVLGIAPVQCSTANHADPLEVPSAGLLQRLGALDEPPAQLAHPIGTCTVASPAQTVISHHAASGDVLADSDAMAVSLGASTALFALGRETAGGPSRVAVRALDAHGALTPAAWSLDGALRLVAAGRVGNDALALVTHEHSGTNASLFGVTAAGRARPAVPLPLSMATSGVFSDDGRTLFVVGSGSASAHRMGLFRIAVGGRPGAPVTLANLSEGDVVLDAIHAGHETTVLLARPDALGADVSRTLAVITVPDRAGTVAQSHPFAEPRGHGRGPAWLAHGAGGLLVMYSEGNLLRAADVDHGTFRHARSVLGTYEGGGAALARSASGTDGTWLALTSGLPPDASRVIAPVSLAHVSPRAEVRVASTDVAATDHIIAGHASIARAGDRIAMLYAQPEGTAGANWRVLQLTCREGAAASSTSSPPPAASASPSQSPAPTQTQGGHR
ncbi:MAG: hypothetical protein WCJ30_00995 [Deltaproteobacteria bacterium]